MDGKRKITPNKLLQLLRNNLSSSETTEDMEVESTQVVDKPRHRHNQEYDDVREYALSYYGFAGCPDNLCEAARRRFVFPLYVCVYNKCTEEGNIKVGHFVACNELYLEDGTDFPTNLKEGWVQETTCHYAELRAREIPLAKCCRKVAHFIFHKEEFEEDADVKPVPPPNH